MRQLRHQLGGQCRCATGGVDGGVGDAVGGINEKGAGCEKASRPFFVFAYSVPLWYTPFIFVSRSLDLICTHRWLLSIAFARSRH